MKRTASAKPTTWVKREQTFFCRPFTKIVPRDPVEVRTSHQFIIHPKKVAYSLVKLKEKATACELTFLYDKGKDLTIFVSSKEKFPTQGNCERKKENPHKMVVQSDKNDEVVYLGMATSFSIAVTLKVQFIRIPEKKVVIK